MFDSNVRKLEKVEDRNVVNEMTLVNDITVV